MPAILSRLSILFINYISGDLDNKITIIQAFRSVPDCQTCMRKRSISNSFFTKALRIGYIYYFLQEFFFCKNTNALFKTFTSTIVLTFSLESIQVFIKIETFDRTPDNDVILGCIVFSFQAKLHSNQLNVKK